ncbi:MAG: oligosaccharide flippase family protein [Candidatus Paceibacterota bacterium]
MKDKIKKILEKSQKYAKTDMLYVAKGGFWLTIAKGASIATSFLLMLAFANWLPQEEFGTYQFILSVAGILSIFTLPGVNTALTKSVAKNMEGSLVEAFRAKLSWGLLASLGMLMVSGWYFFNANTLLGWSFLVGGIFISLKYASTVFSSYWNGNKKFNVYSKYSIYSSVLATIILISTIYLTNNVIYIVGAFFGSYAVFNYLFYVLTKRQIENNDKDPETVPYGKSLTIMRIISIASNELDRVLMWKFMGPAQVAIYSFSILPINKLISLVPIPTLALPKLSDGNMSDEKKAGLMDKFWRLLIIMIPITAGLILIAPFIYRLAFPQYIESVVYFQILSLMLLAFPFSLLNTALVGEVKKKALYMIKTVPPILKIALLASLIPLYGILGAVIAMIAGKALQSIMEFYYFRKI